jgi:transcription antitermination factor NusG
VNCLTETSTNYGPVSNPTASGSRWYAMYTYSRHEKVVSERLRGKHIESFLPTSRTESRWAGRQVQVATPIFPGYVFARIGLDERSRVLNIPGVIKILSVNGKPAPIDDSEIEALMRCTEQSVELEPCPLLEVGFKVRVRSGLLEGLEGFVSRSKNDRRLIIPISMINQSVAFEIDAQLLEPLGRGQQ